MGKQITEAMNEAGEQDNSYTAVRFEEGQAIQGATFKGHDEDGFAVFSVPFSL